MEEQKAEKFEKKEKLPYVLPKAVIVRIQPEELVMGKKNANQPSDSGGICTRVGTC